MFQIDARTILIFLSIINLCFYLNELFLSFILRKDRKRALDDAIFWENEFRRVLKEFNRVVEENRALKGF